MALGCRRASTTSTWMGCPLHDDRMSSPVGPSIQYPLSLCGVSLISAVSHKEHKIGCECGKVKEQCVQEFVIDIDNPDNR